MRLILVRHGDAHAGLHGVIAGPKGCRGLTDLGRSQAEKLQDHLAAMEDPGVDRLIASELPRAIETAQIIAPAVGADEIPRDCDLCEVHTGEADATDWAEYPERFGTFDMAAEPDRPFAPGGDSWNSFNGRVGAMMDRLADDHAGRTVMAVCHAGVIAASLRVRFGLPGALSDVRLVPTNTGRTVWERDDATKQWTLRTYDDDSHLATRR